MDYQALINLAMQHKWLALAVIVIPWLTTMLSDQSRFPVTVFKDKRWAPIIVLVLGQVYGVLQHVLGGMSWKDAAVQGVLAGIGATGFFAVLVRTIYDGELPPWMRTLALVAMKNPEPTKTKTDPPPAPKS